MKHESNGDDETTRSGLFYEAIRIIKEMRNHDRELSGSVLSVRPRYGVYENVPGAFSSNRGEDFRAVLTALVQVADESAPDVPMPESGRWSKSGCIWDEMGNWSIAWRTHDAQYYGVPQRRKRISVLADFGGLTAPEILFDPKYERTTEDGKPVSLIDNSGGKPGQQVQPFSESVSGYPEPSGETGQRTSCRAESSTGSASEPVRDGWVESEGTYYDNGFKNDDTICLQGNGIDRSDTAGCNGAGWRRGGSYTLNTIDRPAVMAVDCRNGTENECINGTLQAKDQGYNVNSNNIVRTSSS